MPLFLVSGPEGKPQERENLLEGEIFRALLHDTKGERWLAVTFPLMMMTFCLCSRWRRRRRQDAQRRCHIRSLRIIKETFSIHQSIWLLFTSACNLSDICCRRKRPSLFSNGCFHSERGNIKLTTTTQICVNETTTCISQAVWVNKRVRREQQILIFLSKITKNVQMILKLIMIPEKMSTKLTYVGSKQWYSRIQNSQWCEKILLHNEIITLS